MKKLFFASSVMLITFFGCKPKPYDVSREIVINAPVEAIFEQVNAIKNQGAWSPWEKMDPNMSKTYEGPESGVGAKYSWSGNDSVGTGSMELIESKFPSSVNFTLIFTSPWEAVSEIYWNFEPAVDGVKVTWGNKGELPGYLFWMSEKDMEDAMGKDFENGLQGLKEIVEAQANAKPDFNIEQTTVTAITIFSVTDEVGWEEIGSEFFGARYGEIGAYLKEDAANLTAPPLAIYHVWDEENKRAKVEVALACNSTKPGDKRVVKGKTHEGTAVKGSFYGPYEGTGAVHYAIEDYLNANALQIAGSPWEVYVTDPGEEPDTTKWLTEIFYPVMPLESAKQ